MISSLPLHWAIVLFIGFALIIATAGTYLTRAGDRLADQTGWGEAVIGGMLLGAVTSLSGITTSVTAAMDGYAQLSVSNAVGGIAAQTLFLAIADLTYRRANLEHASASLPNLLQGILLIIMLSAVSFIIMTPKWYLWFLHPGSILLLIIYIAGSYIVNNARKNPMWQPLKTKETIQDIPSKINQEAMSTTIVKFSAAALVVAVSGYFVAKTGVVIMEQSNLNQSFVGGLFTAVATSLPELVVVLAAVRQGALVMAMGNIIGGNSFDVLFVAFADMAYTEGSIYHHVNDGQLYLIMLALLINSVLLMGMLHRQKHGLAKSGWESISIILLFAGGYFLLYFL